MGIQKSKQEYIPSRAKFPDQERLQKADPAWEAKLVLRLLYSPPLGHLGKGFILLCLARHHPPAEASPPPPRLVNLSLLGGPGISLYCLMVCQSSIDMNPLRAGMPPSVNPSPAQCVSHSGAVERGWASLETILITFMSISGGE